MRFAELSENCKCETWIIYNKVMNEVTDYVVQVTSWLSFLKGIE